MTATSLVLLHLVDVIALGLSITQLFTGLRGAGAGRGLELRGWAGETRAVGIPQHALNRRLNLSCMMA
nr:hypothetical protein BaRGS_024450 [Batillaria attramentaria]